MRIADVGSAERVSAIAFLAADAATRRISDPAPRPRTAAAARVWIARVRHFLSIDPGGCSVAVDDGRIVGFAISQNRGELWFLASFGVLPDYQGKGIGKDLMRRVLAHAAGRRVMSTSTVHPAATRRHRWAGFSLHPLMRMVGTVDRSRLPAIRGLREGRPSDLAWMDRLDMGLRGAGHGPDHEYMLRTSRLVVTKSKSQQGYVYIDQAGGPTLLAAVDRDVAANLLCEALAFSEAETLVHAITTANQWAVDVGLSVGLDIGQEGYLAVHGMADPAPYLPSGHFL